MSRAAVSPVVLLLISTLNVVSKLRISRGLSAMKTQAAANTPILAAVSAPTALAIEYAQASGLTLLGQVQPQRQQIYTLPEQLRASS